MTTVNPFENTARLRKATTLTDHLAAIGFTSSAQVQSLNGQCRATACTVASVHPASKITWELVGQLLDERTEAAATIAHDISGTTVHRAAALRDARRAVRMLPGDVASGLASELDAARRRRGDDGIYAAHTAVSHVWSAVMDDGEAYRRALRVGLTERLCDFLDAVEAYATRVAA